MVSLPAFIDGAGVLTGNYTIIRRWPGRLAKRLVSIEVVAFTRSEETDSFMYLLLDLSF
jgi:hypothetical protein